MKRSIALLLCIALLLSGCAQAAAPDITQEPASVPAASPEAAPESAADAALEFYGLDDAALLSYMEDAVYSGAVAALSSDEYFVENVSAVYVSKEYIEELAFNSQSNIFFGYTAAELNEQFQGTRYIFTIDEDRQTTVRALQEIADTDSEAILKNIAIGSGVILLCVTVSSVAGLFGVGGAAVSMIFALSAKTGAIAALSAGGFGALSAGIVAGIQTGDIKKALDSAALAGSESFKWGAITGVIGGGIKEAVALKGATLSGLSMNEAAAIQKASGYPLDVIKQFQTMEQYEICKNAGLSTQMVNGRAALIRSVDLTYADEFGRTNLERMNLGMAALDPATGQAYELHHIGQKVDSTLAILTRSEHMQGGNNMIWHNTDIISEVHAAGNNWDVRRQAFWKALAAISGGQ